MNRKGQEQDSYRVVVNDPENEQLLWHKWLEIGFILGGSGTLLLGDATYTLHREDIFVINSYQIHNLELQTGSHVLSLLVSPEFFGHFIPESKEFVFDCKSFLYPKKEQQPFDRLRERLAEVIYTYSKSGEKEAFLHIHSKVVALLDFLVQNFGRRQQEGAKKKEDRWIDLVRYMNEFYKEDITLTQLAKREYLSNSYLSRLFQREMGVNFSEYLTNIRLSHAVHMLEQSEKTVTEISFENGFRNVNSFIEAFKRRYNKTPGQYRRSIMESDGEAAETEIGDRAEFSTLFQPLLRYSREEMGEERETFEKKVLEFTVDTRAEGVPVKPVWNRLMNIGYAWHLLLSDVQKQVMRVKQELGITYLRFHGILNDEMLLYREKPDGTPVYNFSYLDSILDFLIGQEICPFVEFSYMPSAMAQRPQNKLFLDRCVISLPQDNRKWCALVNELMEHWIGRYGMQEVSRWLFTPFAGPELYQTYFGVEWEPYMDLVECTVKLLKNFGEQLQIVSPGITSNSDLFLRGYFERSLQRGIFPDILGLYCYYGAEEGEEDPGLRLIETDTAFSIVTSRDENYLCNSYERIRAILKEFGAESLPMMLIEWNSSVWQRDLCNDTSYKAAFICKNILENLERYEAFGYWTISDFMDELEPAEDLFHGGFGLFTACGIPKSGYLAFFLLKFLGRKVLWQEPGCMVTENNGELQIFLYNYCHYDTLYRYRHATDLSRINRYHVFQKGRQLIYHIGLEGLKRGEYKICRYEIGTEGGSAYDAWVKMGAPERPDPYEQAYLMLQSSPVYHTESIQAESGLVIQAALEPHAVELIRILSRSR